MKIVIFTLGLVFLAVGQAYKPTIDNKLINKIDAVEGAAKSLLVEVITILKTGLPTREQVLELVERNGWVIQAKEELKQNEGRKVTKRCRRLLNENLNVVVDEVTVQVKNILTGELIKIARELKNVIIKLEILKEKLEWRHHHVHKIQEEINELAQTVNKLKVTVPALVSSALGNAESNIIPELTKVKILELVTVCLKHHPHY